MASPSFCVCVSVSGRSAILFGLIALLLSSSGVSAAPSFYSVLQPTSARYATSSSEYEQARRRYRELRRLAERKRIQRELRRHREESNRLSEGIRGLRERLRNAAERKRHAKDQRRDNPEQDTGYRFTFYKLTLQTTNGPMILILKQNKIPRVYCIQGTNKKCLDHAESIRFDELAKKQRDERKLT